MRLQNPAPRFEPLHAMVMDRASNVFINRMANVIRGQESQSIGLRYSIFSPRFGYCMFGSASQTKLNAIVSSMPGKNRMLTKAEIKNFPGHLQRYKKYGGLPEFHNIDRNRHGFIALPTDRFMIVLTTSKNNVHAQLVNRSRNYRTVFGSFAGNVGINKKHQQTERCAYRIGENVAKKCKRLGVVAVDVKFRRLMRIETVLQAFQAEGLQIGQLIHEPRLPKTGINSVRPRRRRRV
ncbi:putative ribosomal protein S11 [Babesia divergens]|uniref:Ribosomal protein S11 n=1 Tax=Babesia divergens TaxID=32595 RepID=A0AAD9LFI5_BABDI|nr:putative ribosomal protein S11 [Babesia divergens]